MLAVCLRVQRVVIEMVNSQPLRNDCCLRGYFVAPNTTDFHTSTFSENSKLAKGSPLHLGILPTILKHFPPIFFFTFSMCLRIYSCVLLFWSTFVRNSPASPWEHNITVSHGWPKQLIPARLGRRQQLPLLPDCRALKLTRNLYELCMLQGFIIYSWE